MQHIKRSIKFSVYLSPRLSLSRFLLKSAFRASNSSLLMIGCGAFKPILNSARSLHMSKKIKTSSFLVRQTSNCTQKSHYITLTNIDTKPPTHTETRRTTFTKGHYSQIPLRWWDWREHIALCNKWVLMCHSPKRHVKGA
jgi:hypothetical protein